MEATFDHGDTDGFGLWLDPAVESDPVYSEHWKGHRKVEVTIEPDQIVAYDIDSGRQTWKASAKPTADLLATGDHLIVIEAEQIRSLNTSDGSDAWMTPFGDKLATRPVVNSGRLILAPRDSSIVVFDAATGSLMWRHKIASIAHAPPDFQSPPLFHIQIDHSAWASSGPRGSA